MLSTRLFRGRFFVALLALAGMAAVQAAPVTLKVVSARDEPNFPSMSAPVGVLKGAAVTSYKFLVNEDNTGTTTQRSPDPGTGCNPADATLLRSPACGLQSPVQEPQPGLHARC